MQPGSLSFQNTLKNTWPDVSKQGTSQTNKTYYGYNLSNIAIKLQRIVLHYFHTDINTHRTKAIGEMPTLLYTLKCKRI
jgi:hypothetical protein